MPGLRPSRRLPHSARRLMERPRERGRALGAVLIARLTALPIARLTAVPIAPVTVVWIVPGRTVPSAATLAMRDAVVARISRTGPKRPKVQPAPLLQLRPVRNRHGWPALFQGGRPHKRAPLHCGKGGKIISERKKCGEKLEALQGKPRECAAPNGAVQPRGPAGWPGCGCRGLARSDAAPQPAGLVRGSRPLGKISTRGGFR